MLNDLLLNGHAFSFPQVMRLARMRLGAGGREELPEVPWQERVRVRPALSLAFPAADVAQVERNGTDLLVTSTFLGLYGSASPLPTFYTEDLMDEASADSSVCRDFLDILHQRLYQLYFQCWSKYRLFIQVAEAKNPLDRERLFCLIGLGEKELRDSVPDAWSLLRYTGLLTRFPRSAGGLRTLLRDSLGVGRLEVEQCVLRRVPIPADQRMSLGISGMSLGVNTVMGCQISDRMGKFRILIGPLKKKAFDSFLPGTTQHDKLTGLIRIYILDPFDFDLKITLAAREAGPISLGDPDGARLGWNSWCFSGQTMGEVDAIFPITQSASKAPTPAVNDFGCPPERNEPATLIDYYQQELARLRDLATRYTEAHPEIASLVSGRMADPGVERLFEGVAFLNANLQQKLDDDFPEVIHELMNTVQPESLQPVPSSTIIVFMPKANCTEPQNIPVGTELRSIPVEGTACRFTTRYPVEIHPLTLTGVSFEHPSGKPAAITLNLKLAGIALSEWKLKSLRLFLAGESKQAANLHLVLLRYLKRIVIAPLHNGKSLTLDATHLTSAGFEDADALFPVTASGIARHRLILEFFIQPDKFLFLDLHGWEKWRRRGEAAEFEIRFELDKIPFALHQVSKTDFALFATPAVNVFKHRAEPIATGNQHLEYQVKPTDDQSEHYDIYSVESVAGLLDNTGQKMSLQSSEQGSPQSTLLPTYHIKRRNAGIRDGLDTFISLETAQKTASKQITSLVVELACTNRNLAERLQLGNICKDSDNSPGFVEFTNCKPVTRSACINPGNNTLWRLYSHLNMNLSLLSVSSLRAMLELVSTSSKRDYATARLNTSRIQGITDLRIEPADRLMGRSILRGWEIRIRLDSDFYNSTGDLYLFGTLLDHFLRGFATQSCFTRTIVENVRGGRTYEWPVKMGRRTLV